MANTGVAQLGWLAVLRRLRGVPCWSPAYTVFGTIDQAGIDVVAGIAADGNDGSNPAGGGAPNTPIDITEVTVN